MEITRFAEARPYTAPKHHDMRGLRLQGFDASSAGFAWTGLSHFLPGAGAEMDAGPLEKIYVVLDGAVTIELGDGSVETLTKFDSCFIPGGEARAIRNEGNAVASMLVGNALSERRIVTLPAIDPAALFDVAGKSAIVVGATGAFGQVVCATLGRAGAKLTIAAGNGEALASLADDLSQAGIVVAIANRRPDTEADCETIVATAAVTHGGVDILVVASGMNDVAPIVDMTPERFEAVMRANVDGAWLIARAAGKAMIAQGRGGKVVLTSSARGKLGHPAGYSAYCTSKAAVDGMTRALGCEWGKHGITVNAIAPTVFRSPLTAWMFADDDKAKAVREGFLARVPVGRLGEPEDLAGPLLFLCSRASDFHTGHVVYADGGYTAG